MIDRSRYNIMYIGIVHFFYILFLNCLSPIQYQYIFRFSHYLLLLIICEKVNDPALINVNQYLSCFSFYCYASSPFCHCRLCQHECSARHLNDSWFFPNQVDCCLSDGPEQVHLALGHVPTDVTVSWTTRSVTATSTCALSPLLGCSVYKT